MCKLYNVLRSNFGFIGYFDGTGGLLCIKRSAFKDHVIHSKFSWQPREVLLNDKDFNYAANTHLAMTLMEHIGHSQSGKEFAKAFKIFHRAADEVHGKPEEPLYNSAQHGRIWSISKWLD